MLQDFLKEDGLHVTLEGVYGNTFSSHRLVAYAQQQSLEKADEVMGRLLHACHGQVGLLSLEVLDPASDADSCLGALLT